MNKQIYLGGTPLIDLSGYATESYVNEAVSQVDVTEQLQDYVLKTALDASYGAVDASIKNSDASIASLKSILSQITGDGAEVTAAIDTFNELKAFVSDYTTANDLSTLIATVKSQAVSDAASDAATKYQPIGNYVVQNDISTFVDAADVAAQINTSIGALNLSQYAKDASLADYVKTADLDLSPYAKDASLADYATNSSVATNYMTKNDASNHVTGTNVTAIVQCSSTDYAAIETKSPTTLYIVSE